jgi:nucleoside-diphosphate kinase
MERTLAIIKPDAVAARHAGAILQRIESAGFVLRGMRLVHLTRSEAEGFYAVHRERPFFGSLTGFMSSGPAIVLALESDDAIRRWRDLMGATDPEKAAPGSLRREFGTSIERNATHGSDAPETAAVELDYFFRGVELG